MSPVYPTLFTGPVPQILFSAFPPSLELDQSMAPDPRPLFQIGPSLDGPKTVAVHHALLIRQPRPLPVIEATVQGGMPVHVTNSDMGLHVFASDVKGGTPPPRSVQTRRGVTVFQKGETLASFIADKPQRTFFLGINPESHLMEAHEASASDRVPEFCRVKLETPEAGQRPAFFFWDPELVTEAESWVSFRMRNWNFVKRAGQRVKHITKSLFSFTLSVMAGRELAVTDVQLPPSYKLRVEGLYSVYREYLKAGCLPYFQEMLRLGEWRGGRLQHFVAFEKGSTSRYEENLADFSERIAVTMGLDRFILSISSNGTLTAIQDVETAPPGGSWNFLLTQVSSGAFTVARQTSAGGWEPLNPRVYDSHSDIVPILAGPAAKYDEQARLGLDYMDIDTEKRRIQVSLLLTLAARGADYADLQTVIAARPDSVAGYVDRLLEFSVAHPHYMDFLSRVPHLDEAKPEIRFLSAVDQIYTALFARLLHRATGEKLGTYGHYYLRFALRIYVAERVRRDFASFVADDQTGIDSLNLFSSQLLGVRGRRTTPRSVRGELSGIPISEFVALAVAHKDQAKFVEGTPARDEFMKRARTIARDSLYPTGSDEPLN